jgi:hypothetical protein
MSAFISKEDYIPKIRRERLDQILEAADEDEDALLNSAEEDAIALVRKHLDNYYDMDYELAKTGTDRNKVLKYYIIVLVIAFIYDRIPDEMVPERIVKHHESVMKALEKIESGKSSIPGLKLKTVTNSEGETENYTRRRFGSQPKRSHDGYSPRYLKG